MRHNAAPSDAGAPPRDATAGEIYAESKSIYRRNMGTCVCIFLAAQGVVIIGAGVVAGLGHVKLPSVLGGVLVGLRGRAAGDMLGVALYTALGIAQGVMSVVVTADLVGRRVTAPGAFVVVWPVMGRLAGTAFITSVLLGAGFKAYGLPALALYVVFYAAVPAAVVEARNPLRAIQRSWQIVSTRPFGPPERRRMLGRTVYLAVAGVLGLMWATVPVMLVQAGAIALARLAPVSMRADLTALIGGPLAGGILIAVGVAIVYPIFSVAHTVLYYDVVILHEGYDVAALARPVSPAKPMG